MKGMELLQKHKAEILEIAKRRGVERIRVFGSVARGEDTPESDIDLLVKMADGRSYFDLCGFAQETEDMIHKSVDVVSENGIHPLMRSEILSVVRPFYNA